MFLLILIIVIFYLLTIKNKESFIEIDQLYLSTTINNNINNSEFKDSALPLNYIYELFNSIYKSYDSYESAVIIFNNRDLFNRFFILKKNELQNNIIKINKILESKNNYQVINKDSDNVTFWNITLNNKNNLKNHFDNIIRNTTFLSDDINRRKIIMRNDNLRILFKSILDNFGQIILNS